MDILNSIAKKVKSIVNLPVYAEQQKQGFKEPSFYIEKVSTGSNPLFFQQQYRKYQYQLVYFPKPDQVNKDIGYMEDLLLNNFTDLDLGSVRNRDFQKQDNTLLFSFELDIIAKPVDDSIKQQNMKYKGDV